jgi:predicted esterase
VLLHGRGRSPEDVLLLAERIGLDDVAYVAPAAADHSWWPGSFLAAEYALHHPGRYGGLLFYTGGFCGPRGTIPPRLGTFDGTPAYLGTSDPDGWVPAWRVRETSAALSALGASVTVDVFEGMDHHVNDAEIEAGRALLQRL